MEFVLITGNENKLREAEQILGFRPNNIDLDLDEIQELNSDKVAEHKAKQAWSLVKKPLVVSDQSLYISCLNGFPGPLIKWFWKQVSLEKICQIVHSFSDHNVYAQTTLTYYDGEKMRHFYGKVYGAIPPVPRGTNGFAWDTIFIPQGYDKTFAEMAPEEKNAISMHRIALEKLRDFLNSGAQSS